MRYFSVVRECLDSQLRNDIRADADPIQVGQIPALDKWLGKNPYWPRSLYKFDDFSVAAGFSVERFMERMQNPGLGQGRNDLLNGFLEAKKEHPELVTDNEVIGYMIINVSIMSPTRLQWECS